MLGILNESTATRIAKMLKKLPEKFQKKILSEVEKEYLLQTAKELDRSVKKNNTSMDEIVEASRIVRKKLAKQYNAK